jgi:hypothetical protein
MELALSRSMDDRDWEGRMPMMTEWALPHFAALIMEMESHRAADEVTRLEEKRSPTRAGGRIRKEESK